MHHSSECFGSNIRGLVDGLGALDIEFCRTCVSSTDVRGTAGVVSGIFWQRYTDGQRADAIFCNAHDVAIRWSD